MKRLFSFAASLGVLSLILTGCGGGEDDPVMGVPLIASPSPSTYAGTYRSTVALPDGKSGTMQVTVGTDNTATGTLTVVDSRATRQATAFSFAAGTYQISGTVDPTTGAFQMSGSIAGQSFSYTGTLPTPGNGNVGGSYTLTAGGQTITGSFNTGGVVTPTPTPSATPSGNGGQGGTQSFTFSNISTADIDLSPFTNANASTYQNGIVGVSTTSGGNNNVTANAYSSVNGSVGLTKFRAVSVSLTKIGGNIAAGDTFDLAAYGAEAVVSVSQFDYTPGAAATTRIFLGKRGTVTVVNRTATSVTVRVTGVAVEGASYYSSSGSFTVDGEITAALQ